MSTPLLSVEGLSKRFGGLVALHDVGFDVAEGEIVGIMGANGAGKTTLFSLIAGNARPTSGRIVNSGGTPSGTAKAREDSWQKMLAFVGRALNAE